MIGAFIAATGAIKDTRWEPFSKRKFIRSPMIAIAWAFGLSMIFEFDEWFILALSAGMFERLTTEVWKCCLRKKPSKFNSETRDIGWFSN